jgi:hypothetical protein
MPELPIARFPERRTNPKIHVRSVRIEFLRLDVYQPTCLGRVPDGIGTPQ